MSSAPRTASLSGAAKDPGGKPVADARVCAIEASESRLVACVLTDDRGRYAISPLAPGAYQVVATASGFAASSARDGQPIALLASQSQVVDVVMQPGGARAAGIVLDATGGPIPHAAVRAEVPPPSPLVVDVEADDSGHFAVDLPPGRVGFTARAEAYAPARWFGVAPTAAVRLVLIPGGKISGTVVAAAPGAPPVANVEVRAAPFANPLSPLFQAETTDAEGHFEIRGLEPGRYALTASGAGWRGTSDAPIDLALAQAVEGAQVVVRRASQVLGRVLLAGTTEPCRLGIVHLGPPDPREPPVDGYSSLAAGGAVTELTTSIGPDGAARFSSVPAGRYYVRVQCVDHILSDGPRVLDVADAPVEATWRVAAGAGMVLLTVDDRGRPVPSVQFVLRYPRWTDTGPTAVSGGRTNAEGRYEYPLVLRPGVYEVSPAAPFQGEAVQADLGLRAAPVTVTLKIAGSASILAHVRTRAGDGVDGVTVAAVAEDETSTDGSASPTAALPAVALGAGDYRVTPLKPGRYEVRVDDGVNATVSAGEYSVGAGDTAVASVEYDREGQIRGRVVGVEGTPVPNAWVSAAATSLSERAARTTGALSFGPFGPTPKGRVLTDDDGRFSIGSLAGGAAAYTLRAEKAGAGSGMLEVVAGATSDVKISLSPAVPGQSTAER
jgi:hypothetical protein